MKTTKKLIAINDLPFWMYCAVMSVVTEDGTLRQEHDQEFIRRKEISKSEKSLYIHSKLCDAIVEASQNPDFHVEIKATLLGYLRFYKVETPDFEVSFNSLVLPHILSKNAPLIYKLTRLPSFFERLTCFLFGHSEKSGPEKVNVSCKRCFKKIK